MNVPGPHAERLARGAVLQQGAQVVRLVGGFGVLTLLARELTLAELGVYAILLSLATYTQFLKSSVMSAAVVGVADTLDDRERQGVVVSTGLVIYAGIGVVASLALAGVGLTALPILDVPRELEESARLGVAGLAIVTAIGWPVQIFDDLLRGMQRFAAVSVLEIVAMAASVAGMVALVVTEAPVWALVTWNAAIPLVTGVCCLLALPFIGVHVTVAPRYVERAEIRRFGSASGFLALAGIADLATYSADRFLLGAIRGAAFVGLYEGVLQVQNIVRFLNGVLTQPAMPVARRFLTEGDTARVRELFLRGLRYSLAITAPFVVVLAVLSGPVLETWLGAKFLPAKEEAAVFVGAWLLLANGGLVATVLTSAGRFLLIARLSWLAALVNVGLIAALTPVLGLWGPVIGMTAGSGLVVAISMPIAIRLTRSGWQDVLRQAWLPAYTTAAAVGAMLVVVRVGVGPPPGVATVAVAGVAVLVYWLLYAAVWLRPDERSLVRRTLRTASGAA